MESAPVPHLLESAAMVNGFELNQFIMEEVWDRQFYCWIKTQGNFDTGMPDEPGLGGNDQAAKIQEMAERQTGVSCLKRES